MLTVMMNDNSVLFFACILAYLIGSIPVGFLVAKARGIDISQVGSGNMGATNITRNLGWKLGVLVGILDFGKSFLPILLARRFFTQDWHILLIAIIPVIGHIFPVWLNFKGGKGVATIFGILAAFFGLHCFLIFLLLWFLVVKLVKLMSLVNLVVGLLLPLAFWMKFRELPFTLFGLLLGIIIWWSHRENIKRLLAGNENRIDI
jgi:glycerol-3-phosphate acyltransferase PlsY